MAIPHKISRAKVYGRASPTSPSVPQRVRVPTQRFLIHLLTGTCRETLCLSQTICARTSSVPKPQPQQKGAADSSTACAAAYGLWSCHERSHGPYAVQ